MRERLARHLGAGRPRVPCEDVPRLIGPRQCVNGNAIIGITHVVHAHVERRRGHDDPGREGDLAVDLLDRGHQRVRRAGVLHREIARPLPLNEDISAIADAPNRLWAEEVQRVIDVLRPGDFQLPTTNALRRAIRKHERRDRGRNVGDLELAVRWITGQVTPISDKVIHATIPLV